MRHDTLNLDEKTEFDHWYGMFVEEAYPICNPPPGVHVTVKRNVFGVGDSHIAKVNKKIRCLECFMIVGFELCL